MAEAALQESPRPAAGEMLLEVENLHVRYRMMGPIRAKILQLPNRFLDAVLDVSFRLRRGTTLALVGESGSGKSTLGAPSPGWCPSPGAMCCSRGGSR